MFTNLIPLSESLKTRGIAVTYTSSETCSDACGLKVDPVTGKPGPCYAKTGNVNLHWTALDKGFRGSSGTARAYTFGALLAGLFGLPADRRLRLNVAGDLPDVDLELGSLRIVETKRKVATPRLLPIPRPVMRLVQRLIARGFPTLLATHEGMDAQNALRLTLARWREDHPEAVGFIFHAFRHAYASRSEAAGLDPVLRSRGLMGHQTIQMTARYSHRALEQLRAAQDLIASSERASRRGKRSRGVLPGDSE